MGILLLGSAPTGSTGHAMINLGLGEIIPANFINVLKTCSHTFFDGATAGHGVDPGILDDQGFPTSAPSSTISLSSAGSAPSPAMWSGVEYTLEWPATRMFTMTFVGTNTLVASSNATVTGGVGSNMTVTTQPGLAGWVRFTIVAGGLSIQFPTTGTYAPGSGEVALYRTSDAAAYAAGEIFTPEFISVITGLKPKTIRPMGWSLDASNRTNEVKWDYRTAPEHLCWGSKRFFPGAWGGQITGTDTYTVAAAPDTPLSGWEHGEAIQGDVLNAATKLQVTGAVSNGGNVQLTITSNLAGDPTAPLSNGQAVWVIGVGGTTEANVKTTILSVDDVNKITIDVPFVHSYTSGGFVATQTLTITGKTGGAKFIADQVGAPIFYGLSESVASTAGLATYVYDAILDIVIWRSGGIVNSIPIEAQVALANKTKTNLWFTIPFLADDNYVTQLATIAYNDLNPALYFYPEYSNEIWNTGFTSTFIAIARGTAFGFPGSGTRERHGWYAIRVREIMGNLIPPVWAGRMSKLRRTLMFQAASDTNTLNYRMKGGDLVPGNAAYNAYTGSADYSTKPNRPIDVVDVIGYAPYSGGANLFFGADIIGGNYAPTAVHAPFYQALVDLWEGGDTAGAVAMVDDDIRRGRTSVQTVTASGTTFTTPLAHGFSAVYGSLVAFQATGGTMYSGINDSEIYRVASTPTSTTFTLQRFSNGFPSGAAINAGSVGTGTVTVGWVGGHGTATRNVQTMQALNSNWYQFGEWLAAQFDADRPVGMGPIRVEQYEGSLEPLGPSSAQCTTLGITGSDPAGSIAAAILAWKNDPVSAATQKLYFEQFMGADPNNVATYGLMPHSKTPAHLVLLGGGLYGLVSGVMPNSAPYELYDGFADFVGVS